MNKKRIIITISSISIMCNLSFIGLFLYCLITFSVQAPNSTSSIIAYSIFLCISVISLVTIILTLLIACKNTNK